uniref:Hemicentin-1-like n=1 Tax=Saccoglossus kowalevskii TaxID=10224 RepID=A0ABM0MYQ2_SACKO|nr:PREDICTED: hemicentin-1-like [Saccoglossus kowalevskii]
MKVGTRKLEVGTRKFEVGSRKLELRSRNNSNNITPDILIGPVGETVEMKCTVSSGLPKWYRVVPGSGDIQLSDGTLTLNPYQIVGDQSSGEYFLQIPNVQLGNSHTFQCELFNADPPYLQAILTVIDEGGDLEMICQNVGVPTPFKYTWTLANIYGNTITLSEVTDTPQLNNIQPSDAGTYTCIATIEYYDDTEDTSSDTTSIIVNYSPRVNKDIKRSGASKGATIACEADALPTANITWYKHCNEINNGGNRRRVIEFVDDNIRQSTLWIFNVLPESDYGVYMCKSVNRLGSDIHHITLNETVIPETPVNIELTDRYYDRLTIELIPMFHQGVPLGEVNYYIEYRSPLDASFLTWPSHGRGTTNTIVIVYNLEPSTAYEFKVK